MAQVSCCAFKNLFTHSYHWHSNSDCISPLPQSQSLTFCSNRFYLRPPLHKLVACTNNSSSAACGCGLWVCARRHAYKTLAHSSWGRGKTEVKLILYITLQGALGYHKNISCNIHGSPFSLLPLHPLPLRAAKRTTLFLSNLAPQPSFSFSHVVLPNNFDQVCVFE